MGVGTDDRCVVGVSTVRQDDVIVVSRGFA